MTLHPAELFDRANALADQGRLEEALAQYEATLAELNEAGDRASVLLAQIGCLNKLGRAEDARACLRKVGGLVPSDDLNRPHVDFAEAGILAYEGKKEEALRILSQLVNDKRRVLSAENGDDLYKEIQLRRMTLLIDLRRDQEARPILEEVLTVGIVDASVPFYAGLCYFGLGEYKLAKKHYQDALRVGLAPVWEWQAHVHLGPIYYAEGALAKAKLSYERAEALSHEVRPPGQDRKNVYVWLAKICRELDQQEEAARYEQLAKDAR